MIFKIYLQNIMTINFIVDILFLHQIYFPEEKLESIILLKLGTEIGIGLASDPNRKYDLIIDIDHQTFYNRYTMRTFCFSKEELINIIQDAYKKGRQDSIENSLTFSKKSI